MFSYPIVGIAGTAKNTGKTTALNAILAEAERTATSVGLTSIGYDGEAIDNVTGLPKPRVNVSEGSIVTTSHSCVPKHGWAILDRTGFSTALGEVVILRCVEAGQIVLAGPNKRSELAEVIRRMRQYEPALILVDGALNRIIPLTVADGVVLATGAARNSDIPELVKETSAIEKVLAIQGLLSPPDPDSPILPILPSVVQLQDILRDRKNDGCRLIFSGVAPADVMQMLVDAVDDRAGIFKEIVFPDPFSVLLSGDIIRTVSSIRKLERRGVRISAIHPTSLVAITVNPFFPELSGITYRPSTVDPATLRSKMRRALSTPVVDVLHDGPARLWRCLRKDH